LGRIQFLATSEGIALVHIGRMDTSTASQDKQMKIFSMTGLLMFCAAMSTSAFADKPPRGSCPPWECGYNGPALNGMRDDASQDVASDRSSTVDRNVATDTTTYQSQSDDVERSSASTAVNDK